MKYAYFKCRNCNNEIGWNNKEGCFVCGLCSDCLNKKVVQMDCKHKTLKKEGMFFTCNECMNVFLTLEEAKLLECKNE